MTRGRLLGGGSSDGSELLEECDRCLRPELLTIRPKSGTSKNCKNNPNLTACVLCDVACGVASPTCGHIRPRISKTVSFEVIGEYGLSCGRIYLVAHYIGVSRT
ncbi:hypothetical protein MTR67_048303 [Solanum verrucosum]|uniref:Uncharacterized protein n=1 Tax=Solanum verrucosum TaxID=315347 RepID=A0AAF0ZZ25_SOLVR|nr:hypothetical protein MTR67_048303 [Solanum verrucosum]